MTSGTLTTTPSRIPYHRRVREHLLRRRFLAASATTALIAALVCFPATAASQQPDDVQALMSMLKRVERVEVAYRETVESGLIDTVISTRGRLVYAAPDAIRRVSDQGDGFVLDGETIGLIADGEVVNEMDIADVKPLEAMIGALRAIFAGDLARLRQDYQLDYQVGDSQWTLNLTPRATGLSRLFQLMRITGDGAVIKGIAIHESNGDLRTLRMRLLERTPAELD
jgi:outer membrane lipoprotein-sorting protein